MFDFDKFVNEPAHALFGRQISYRPRNVSHSQFTMSGDFHISYMDINLVNAGADISSAKTVVFVRDVDFPERYPISLAGDYVTIDGKEWQVINIEPHIPGSKKLILHEP